MSSSKTIATISTNNNNDNKDGNNNNKDTCTKENLYAVLVILYVITI